MHEALNTSKNLQKPKIFFPEKKPSPKLDLEKRQIKDFFSLPTGEQYTQAREKMFKIYAKAILETREQKKHQKTMYHDPMGHASTQNFLIQEYLSKFGSNYDWQKVEKIYRDFHRDFHNSKIFQLEILPKFHADNKEEFSETGIDQVIRYICERSKEKLPLGRFRQFGFNDYLDAHHGIDVIEMIGFQRENKYVMDECNLVQVKSTVDNKIFEQYQQKHAAYVRDFMTSHQELEEYYWDGTEDAIYRYMMSFKSNMEDLLLVLMENEKQKRLLSTLSILQTQIGLKSKQIAPLAMLVRNYVFKEQYQSLKTNLVNDFPNNFQQIDVELENLDKNFNRSALINSCFSELWSAGKLFKRQELFNSHHNDKKAIEYKL